MPEQSNPVAVVATAVPTRVKPSVYPEPFAAEISGATLLAGGGTGLWGPRRSASLERSGAERADCPGMSPRRGPPDAMRANAKVNQAGVNERPSWVVTCQSGGRPSSIVIA